jgi:probable HAF family extracellular repeat protein
MSLFSRNGGGAFVAGLTMLAASAAPARGSGIYQVTDLGSIVPVGLTDSGQVYGNRPLLDHPGLISTVGGVLYNSYGPNAGQYLDPSTLQPIGRPASSNAVSGNDSVSSVMSNGQALVYSPGGASLTNGTTSVPVHTPTVSSDQTTFRPIGVGPGGQMVWNIWVRPSPDLWQPHTMLYDGQKLTDLGTFGGNLSTPIAVSPAGGWITGYSSVDGGAMHAFLSNGTPGQLTDLGTLGGGFSLAAAVNDHGQVVGSSMLPGWTIPGTSISEPGPTHAFLYSNGQMIDLGTLPNHDGDSQANAINSQGEVVGSSGYLGFDKSAKTSAGFLYANGQMLNLNNLLDPNAHFTINNAIAINDSGQILATGFNGVEQDLRTLLLTPEGMPTPVPPEFALPEPCSFVVFGLMALACACRLAGPRSPRFAVPQTRPLD